ncbi:hypothetical protein K474DRAFT_912325 [Panus rudis PR-1116 ss-1]|nr:hypothetical protein K474DRAFT_912325 [Panus rudis PR-1116 ss-1]
MTHRYHSTRNPVNGPILDEHEGREYDPLLSVSYSSGYGTPTTALDSDDSDDIDIVEELIVEPRHKSTDSESEDSQSSIEHDSLERGHDGPTHDHLAGSNHGHGRHLGTLSTAFLIFNRVIGTGIFATSSVILRSAGSVGLSLVLWLLGALVAACGTAVYIELGTGIPRSGGEKNYLDFIYRRPKLLAVSIYAMYAVFIGWSSASVSVFGEYLLHAINPNGPPSPITSRLASLTCITTAFLLHGTC